MSACLVRAPDGRSLASPLGQASHRPEHALFHGEIDGSFQRHTQSLPHGWRSQPLDTGPHDEASRPRSGRNDVDRPRAARVRSPFRHRSGFAKAHVLTGSDHSNRDAGSLGMKLDLLPHGQVLMIGQDRLDVPYRDSHHALDHLVGIEPGAAKPELHHPPPYHRRGGGHVNGPCVHRDGGRSERIPWPSPGTFCRRRSPVAQPASGDRPRQNDQRSEDETLDALDREASRGPVPRRSGQVSLPMLRRAGERRPWPLTIRACPVSKEARRARM